MRNIGGSYHAGAVGAVGYARGESGEVAGAIPGEAGREELCGYRIRSSQHTNCGIKLTSPARPPEMLTGYLSNKREGELKKKAPPTELPGGGGR